MTILRSILYASLALLALAVAALAIRAQLVLNEARLLINDGRATMQTVNAAASTWNTYSTTLTKQLASEKNQKAIDAGIAVAASLQGSIRLVNSQVVPRTMRLLDATEQTALTLNALVANTDKRLTGDDGLLPESTRLLASVRTTADAFQVDSKQLSAELVKVVQQGQVSMANVNAVLASPEWLSTLKNIEKMTADGAVTTTNIAEATKAMPGTAASIEKILTTAERWQKPALLIGMISTIARAFIP